MSVKLNDIGAWLKKLGSSQTSDLAPVVLSAYHCQCVKPSCNDCSVLRPQQSKSEERVDLQELFVTTLEANILPQLQAHLRGARSYTAEVYTKPSRTPKPCPKPLNP